MAYNHENLIVGCGNILFKDDGFGPEVINYMKENNIQLPGDTCLIDGATSAPHYIFTLPEDKWKNIIIIDIAQLDTKPGTLAVLDLGDVKEEDRYMDVHGVSVTYPLHDLEDKVNIKLKRVINMSIEYMLKDLAGLCKFINVGLKQSKKLQQLQLN